MRTKHAKNNGKKMFFLPRNIYFLSLNSYCERFWPSLLIIEKKKSALKIVVLLYEFRSLNANYHKSQEGLAVFSLDLFTGKEL